MPSQLGQAKLTADNVRYSGDYFRSLNASSSQMNNDVDMYFSQSSIEITPQITPGLAKSIGEVCNRLGIPRASIKAFVYASPEIQAYCVSDGGDSCFIRFSSGLVDLLDASEMEFVAGHELGHFLLNHSINSCSGESVSYEMKILQRAQEISADRLGLLACGSLDVAVKSLMKTVSGLTNEHLIFNVGEFISQIRKIKGEEYLGQGGESHPSMIVRCRALLWFSLSNAFTSKDKISSRSVDLDVLDGRVKNDLIDYVDGPFEKHIESIKTLVAMWMAARAIVVDGAFSKQEQSIFGKMFGDDNLLKFKDFLTETDTSIIKKEVDVKLENATNDLNQALPYSFGSELGNIKEKLKQFKDVT